MQQKRKTEEDIKVLFYAIINEGGVMIITLFLKNNVIVITPPSPAITFFQGDMTGGLGEMLVEGGEEMWEALSQMPVIVIIICFSYLETNYVFFQDPDSLAGSSPKRRKSIPSSSILPKKSPRLNPKKIFVQIFLSWISRADLARVSSSRVKK